MLVLAQGLSTATAEWINLILNALVLGITLSVFLIAFFLYRKLSVQHHIRTPVATILGMTETLIEKDRDEIPEDFRKTMLSTIRNSAESALTALDREWVD